MNSLLYFILQLCFCIAIIIGGHYAYDYLRALYTKPVEKNLYYTQVEKYRNLVVELQQEQKDHKSMEEDLFDFVEDLGCGGT